MSPENAPSEVNVIDFHTHTILSDGELIASELVRRACNIGYRAIGLADHADGSNLEWLVPNLVKVARELNRHQETFVIPGVEITHAPPAQISELVDQARRLGAVFVVVHGESPVGTSRARDKSGGHRGRRGHTGPSRFHYPLRGSARCGQRGLSGNYG